MTVIYDDETIPPEQMATQEDRDNLFYFITDKRNHFLVSVRLVLAYIQMTIDGDPRIEKTWRQLQALVDECRRGGVPLPENEIAARATIASVTGVIASTARLSATSADAGNE